MRLQFTDEIFCFIEFAARESMIAQIILDGRTELIKDEGNFISKSDGDYLTYLPVSKYNKVDDVWKQGRTKIKIGRFIRKFFTEFAIINFEIKDTQIEKFVNLYKSYFSRDVGKLKIVEGRELRELYLEDNYHFHGRYRVGPLWNSCMRQRDRNMFLSLYEKNPDDVKMLVYFSDDNKVRARALLWQNVNEFNTDQKYKVMDRIYYIFDHDVQFFKDWAKENGYLSKCIQNAKSERLFDKNGAERLNLYVDLPVHKLPFAPYLDTFKFYHLSGGRFSNSDYYPYDYTLIQSNGGYERVVEPEPEDFYEEEN